MRVRGEGGEAQQGERDLSGAREEDVRRLDVSMYLGLTVQVLKPLEHLLRLRTRARVRLDPGSEVRVSGEGQWSGSVVRVRVWVRVRARPFAHLVHDRSDALLLHDTAGVHHVLRRDHRRRGTCEGQAGGLGSGLARPNQARWWVERGCWLGRTQRPALERERESASVERTRTEPPPTYSMTIQSLVPETYDPK